MFGYISVDKPELKVKDLETYKAYYCGLCKELGREYGLGSRFTLSYDICFLYLLRSAVSEGKPSFQKSHCPVHIGEHRLAAMDEGMSYAAAVNVLLAVENIKDNLQDEKNIISSAELFCLNNAGQKAAAKYPWIERLLTEQLGRLHKVENARVSESDEAADPFGVIIGTLFENCSEDGNQRKVLWSLGYQMGRWIYLIDAFDDMEKDRKTGNYNPFNEWEDLHGSSSEENAEFVLYASLAGMCDALDLLTTTKHRAILENIIHSGCYKKTAEIINKRKGNMQNGSV